MNNLKLKQLIRESINEYIKAIDEAGYIAGIKAKFDATQEAINKRKKMVELDGLDEDVQGMIDERKVKEVNSEIKALEKSLAKLQKQLDKLNAKSEKSSKVEDAEEKEIVDETSLNEGVTDFPFTSNEDIKDAWQEIYDNILDRMSSLEKLDNEETNKVGEQADDVFLTKYGISYMDAFDKLKDEYGDYSQDTDEETDYWNDGDIDPAGGYGPSSHMEENIDIYEMLYMQKIAGILSETEYKAKVEEAKNKKPSAGMTKKEKSAVAKKAHAGKDIGKKGKGFEDVAKAAGGGKKGERIAAAAMWKSEAKKAKK